MEKRETVAAYASVFCKCPGKGFSQLNEMLKNKTRRRMEDGKKRSAADSIPFWHGEFFYGR